jgi:hypothetical protein
MNWPLDLRDGGGGSVAVAEQISNYLYSAWTRISWWLLQQVDSNQDQSKQLKKSSCKIGSLSS